MSRSRRRASATVIGVTSEHADDEVAPDADTTTPEPDAPPTDTSQEVVATTPPPPPPPATVRADPATGPTPESVILLGEPTGNPFLAVAHLKYHPNIEVGNAYWFEGEEAEAIRLVGGISSVKG